MYGFIIALTVIASILMIGVVLIQKSKGGGLSSQFGGANQLMGVRRTNDVIEKTTWWLAAILGVLAIVSVFFMPGQGDGRTSRVKSVSSEQTVAPGFETETEAPAALPAAPVAPAETPAAE